jgi:hypothetical protein
VDESVPGTETDREALVKDKGIALSMDDRTYYEIAGEGFG